MKSMAFFSACVWLSAAMSSVGVALLNSPVEPIHLIPDAGAAPPEPKGDCGEWDDYEECDS